MDIETMQVALIVGRIFLGVIFLTSVIGKLLNWRSYVETNQAFLGRVVVELWNQDVVGSIEGTSSLLIVRALEALNDPIEPVEWQS